MIWGKYTWVMFHTLAEKIRDDMFDSHKHVVCETIHSLCSVPSVPHVQGTRDGDAQKEEHIRGQDQERAQDVPIPISQHRVP